MLRTARATDGAITVVTPPTVESSASVSGRIRQTRFSAPTGESATTGSTPHDPRIVPRQTTRATGDAHPVPVQITDLEPGDTATVRQIFDGLSGRSRYLRFHAGRSTLPIRMQRGLADVRPGHHIAHVAAVERSPVGLVRWIRFGDDRASAELAVEVIDAAQRNGVGLALIRWAARSALAAGIEWFVGYFSPDNSELRARAITLGAVPDPDDRSLVRVPVAVLLESLERYPPRLPVQQGR